MHFYAIANKSSTYKWHVFLTQIHRLTVGSVNGQDNSEEDDQQR